MSIAASTWALHHAPTKSAQELVILWALSDHAHADGTSSFPKQATLATLGRCDERTIRRHLKALEERGLIRRGDQRLVSHLPHDRRPVVWDLNLSMVRADQADEVAEAPKKRGDNMSPREGTKAPETANGGTICPPRGDTGDRSGGDTGVLQNRPYEPSDESSGPVPDVTTDRAPEVSEEFSSTGEGTATDPASGCGLCDGTGWVAPAVKCTHSLDAVETAQRGAALCREALDEKRAQRSAADPTYPSPRRAPSRRSTRRTAPATPARR